MSAQRTRLAKLEEKHAVALAKQKGCSEAEQWANFVYDVYKRWETWWLAVKWSWTPSPAYFLCSAERRAIEDWRELAQQAGAAEEAEFCGDLLKLPTQDPADYYPTWAKWSDDGIVPVSDDAWCLEQWRKIAHDPIRTAGG
jgi:phosphohistidine phosphatase SixA